MQKNINIPHQQLADFCNRWKIATMALFGSVLRDDFGADSDIDILVKFQPDSGNGLFNMVRMQNELTEILGRQVDLVSWNAVEQSSNAYRKRAILDSAQILYAA